MPCRISSCASLRPASVLLRAVPVSLPSTSATHGLPRRVEAVRAAVRYYASGLLHELMTKDIFLWAQAVAFKGLVSLVPLLLLATGIIGRVLQREKPFEVVEGIVRDLLPPYQTQQFLDALRDLSAASGTITVAGSIGLVVSAVSLMTTLRAVVSNVFREDYHRARSILRGYAFDARMVVQVGLFFLLSISLTILLGWLGSTGSEGFEMLGLDGQVWAGAVRRVALFLPFLLTVAMFAQLYASVPTPRPPLRSVMRGAFVAAILWEVAKQAFTAYAVGVARFDVGTTFGLVLALVFWVYFSGLVLCIGALVTLLSEKRVRAAAMLPAAPLRAQAPRQTPRFALSTDAAAGAGVGAERHLDTAAAASTSPVAVAPFAAVPAAAVPSVSVPAMPTAVSDSAPAAAPVSSDRSDA